MKQLLIFAILAFTATTAYGQSGTTQEAAELAVGDAAPNFELETFDGETVTLSERFGDEGKPVILLFSRANW